MARLIESRTSSGEKPQYRAWYAYNFPHNVNYYAVESPEEARRLIAELAEDSDSSIECSAFGLEELEADGYHEWYDEDGDSITEVMNSEQT